MNLSILKPKKVLNKAYLKVKPHRNKIEDFKNHLTSLLDRINEAETEEFHKNLAIDFLNSTYYKPDYFINTKGRNDLVIHNGKTAKTSVGVIIEAKSPTNKAEMMTTKDLNRKAFQELVLYYLRERITHKNLEIKHLIATNINEWFIFNATTFDRLFAQNKTLVKQFNDFENGRLAETKTNFFYKEIAAPFIKHIKAEIEFTYFKLQEFSWIKPTAIDEKKLIALYKIFSPEHLLKLPFVNDSNSLDKKFYSELLHIIGLTETKSGSKKLIARSKGKDRNPGSIIENTITRLDSLDIVSRLNKPSQFGKTAEERHFNVALELAITWINRVLFLKLMEAQLLKYHNGTADYAFLNAKKVGSYDDLNSLFFQVLAQRIEDRNEEVKNDFGKVPYLNSSLFEATDMEREAIYIGLLKDNYTIPIHSQTVLKDQNGKKRKGKISTLPYLFEFLNAYDFSSEGSEEIQEENKTLINASVLGLIFEKINGYKDGSFFTPGFITMYMCRETIRKAVIQKFDLYFPDYKINRIEDIYELIPQKICRKKANEIINSLKICDPAVGSGHFLVSVLNEIIAIKNDLKILEDKNGKSLNRYEIEVVNDELVVTDEDGELFKYHPGNKESQRIQETLFHEKQTIIENCLFGVDINANSVKICRLRLWIELLKNAYYISPNSSPEKGRWPQAGGVNKTKPEWPQAGGVNKTKPERPQAGGVNKTKPERPQAGGVNKTKPEWPQAGGVKINNFPYLKTFRKELRNNLTPAEAALWKRLKGKQLEGRKFRRQHSVSNYILDFYCPSEKIAIELDGQRHFEATQAEYDRERDLFLEAFGIRVLRFENKWVWHNPEGLLQEVKSYFGKQNPSSNSSPEKGRWPQAGGVNKTKLQRPQAGGVNKTKLQRPQAGGVNNNKPPRPSGSGFDNKPPRPSGTPPFQGGEYRELQTLPNIDINIKCGNSLISRFDLEADLSEALKKSKYSIESYRIAVATYRDAANKEEKHKMEKLIKDIKSDFESYFSRRDYRKKKLDKISGELFRLTNQKDLFAKGKTEKTKWRRKVKRLSDNITKLETEIEQIKNNKIYENAFEWRFEFPEVLNDDGDFVGFDAVIANPPYIKEYEGKEIFDGLRKNEVYQGKMDIWYLFACNSIRLVKKEGIVNFIATNNWVTNAGASKMRNFILDYTQIKQLIDFSNYMVFDTASIQTMIMTFKNKTANNYKFDYRRIIVKNPEYDDALATLYKEPSKNIEYLTPKINKDFYHNKSLIFKDEKTTHLLIKIKGKGDFLLDKKEVANGIHPHHDFVNKKIQSKSKQVLKIGQGVFALSNLELKNLNLTKKEEKDLIKPYFNSEQFHRYYADNQNEYWLIYTSSKFKNPKEILPYPNIKAHLDQFQDIITSDNKPYGLHRTRVEDFFMGEKIIVQRKCPNRPVFTYTDFDTYVSATYYVIKTKRLNQKYLTGLLNSRLIEYWLRHKGKMQGNNFQIDKAPLLEIPIIKPSEASQNKIRNLVTQIIIQKQETPQADTTALEAQIDQMVYKLYGLTEEEIAIIENHI